MRRIVLLFVLCALLLLLPGARAEALDALGDLGVFEEPLTEAEKSISGALRLDGSYDLDGALRRLWAGLVEHVREALADELRLGLRLFLLSLLCALCACFCEAREVCETIDRIGCCGAALLVSDGFSSLLDQAGETVRRLGAYARGVLPALYTAATVGGAALSAPARYAAACLAVDVLMSAAESLILPLIYAFFALSVSQSLYPNPVLGTAARLCKWGAATAMTALTLVFGAYLSLSGLIAASADAVAVKTAKTVIARALPVVGSLLSDSAGVLLSAAALIRNSLGVFALVAVTALCLGPVALYGLRLLFLKAAATASALLPDARLPGLIESFAAVFALLLGLIGCCAAMLFIALVSGMKAVSAV